MSLEQLQTTLSNPAMAGAFDSSAIFDQLDTALQPLAEFDTIEERETLYHTATTALNNYADIVPDTYQNYTDPTGTVVTQYEEQSSNTVSETRLFGRVVRSTERDTFSENESLTLGNGTPLETVFSHSVNESNVDDRFTLTPGLNNTNYNFQESYSIENDAFSLGLTHTDNSRTLAGNPILDTHSTKLELGLADMGGVSVNISDLSLLGERVLEVVTVEYPGLEGEQSTLLLPVSTNLLVPLALGAAEGFANLTLGTQGVVWRSFSQWDAARSRKVMVLLELRERDELARDIAGQLVEPGLWLRLLVSQQGHQRLRVHVGI